MACLEIIKEIGLDIFPLGCMEMVKTKTSGYFMVKLDHHFAWATFNTV